ncbi:MAG: FAD-binding protein [Desulfobacterales bacterium]|nr:FAD-binding protein [Desulfobacterales bacterium]
MALLHSSYKQLEEIVGKSNFIHNIEDRICYAYDATGQTYCPDAVIFPKNATEIAEILTLANEHDFYIIPRGSGTGMTGGSLAIKGGVVLAFSQMNRILKVDKDNLIAHVEPGVITGHLQAFVEDMGLFYPPDPSSSDISTIGGNVAECAGGPRAVKYGVTRDYVLGLEVVLPTGEIIQTGVQTKKGVVGYDLTRLFVGSEGTLGIITRIILKLIPKPEAVQTMLVVFDDVNTAAETVFAVRTLSITPRCIEFMDEASIQCANQAVPLGLPAHVKALLIIQVDGSPYQIDRDMERIQQLCYAKGALRVEVSNSSEDTERIWKARKAISPALYMFGKDKINEDIVVPTNRIPDMIKKIDALRTASKLMMVCFGHAGDGNIHVNIMLNKDHSSELEKAEKVIHEVFAYTLELGGTISGEHGIGITKARYMPMEIGKVELALMKKLKTLFDPKGILNPGKLFL